MSDWKPPERKTLGFWDRLGWKLRKRRLGRDTARQADTARHILEDRARDAGIPLQRGQYK